jgi:hypothetical protein
VLIKGYVDRRGPLALHGGFRHLRWGRSQGREDGGWAHPGGGEGRGRLAVEFGAESVPLPIAGDLDRLHLGEISQITTGKAGGLKDVNRLKRAGPANQDKRLSENSALLDGTRDRPGKESSG